MTDDITREEARAIIRKEYLCVDRDCDIERSCGKCDLMMPSKEPILQAYKMAIKALEQEPCDDAISREMALKECHDIVVEGERYRVIQEETLLGLPPVNPTKTGHWVEENINEWSRKVFCSECGCPPPFEHVSNGDVYSASGYGVSNKTKYCPNCGARMVEPQERSGEE